MRLTMNIIMSLRSYRLKQILVHLIINNKMNLYGQYWKGYNIVDKVTGVNYLTTVGTGLNALTPLLDSDGNVVIDK